MKKFNSSVTIVGAGPGDPDLISLKGLRAIRQSNVILYDALVSPELIKEAPVGCKLVYVGKRKGKKEFSQAEINQLLVFYASRYKRVVRLKGGDPFVFGRGYEELEYATARGVDVNIIPGISSSYAAASCSGIPLTSRGVNESFWVVTGTVSSGEISADLLKAAQSEATIVVLMGLTQLKEIAHIICQARGDDEPMAVIQEASLTSQKVVTGKASTIFGKVTEACICTPAIIMIGKVVNLNKNLNLNNRLLEFSDNKRSTL